MAEREAEAAAGQSRRQFALQRVYIKDLSFESPGAPGVFASEWKPAMNIDLNTRSSRIRDDDYEVVLTLTVTARHEEETVYLVEVQQAGIFRIKGIEDEDLRRVMATACPNMLFPYAREAIDSTLGRGTFPALMLAPVNFDALFQQALKQAREQGEQAREEGEARDAE